MTDAVATEDVPTLPSDAFRFVLRYVDAFRWKYVAMFLSQTAAAAVGIALPWSLGQITARVTGGGAALASLRGPLALFAALGIGDVVFSRIAGSLQFRVGPRLRALVTRELYAYLQRHSQRFFGDNFAGALAHRISETSTGVSQALFALLFDFWPIGITLSVAVALLARSSGALAGFVAAWAALFIAASFILARRCRPYAQRFAAARSVTTGKVVDAVTNLLSIKLFAREPAERGVLDEFLGQEVAAAMTANRRNEVIRWFQHLASLALKLGTLAIALALWARGRIGVGTFVASTGMSVLIINEARTLGRRFMELFEYLGNVSNGVHTIVKPHEILDAPDAKPLVVTRGTISLERVRFGYAADRPVFDGLDVTIGEGERVGLVGFSGSGKSTFVSLLLRLYDPQGGRVLIDGTDVRAVTQASLHEQIGLIPQEPSLFHRSLRANIAIGRPGATEAQIVDAAERAHAHGFIADMPHGYDSLVGERGVKLSGGQRQRIALARVILKNAPILVLDEATSSLDSVTERAIAGSLDDLMRGKTVIVVAHRLSTVARLDRILVFDGGRIVEDGTHKSLLAAGGTYHHLWTRQVDGFLPTRARDAEAPRPEASRSAV